MPSRSHWVNSGRKDITYAYQLLKASSFCKEDFAELSLLNESEITGCNFPAASAVVSTLWPKPMETSIRFVYDTICEPVS